MTDKRFGTHELPDGTPVVIVPTVKATHQVPRNAYAVRTKEGKELYVSALCLAPIETRDT